VRCDMAMLVLPDVFRRTWGHLPRREGSTEAKGELWAEAIDAVRAEHPRFLFIAETYWDLEWRLQLLGFDYTYDKSMYDRLMHGSPQGVRAHLGASFDYQRRCARFLENHDEARVAAALPPDRRQAATVLLATAPGMRFFHEGQFEGRKTRTPVQLARRADEALDRACYEFHERLLGAAKLPQIRRGTFALLTPHTTSGSIESFVAYRWDAPEGAAVVVVNFGPARAECRIPLDIAGIAGRSVLLVDRLTGQEYRRNGDELTDGSKGLYVALPPYGTHVFEVRKR